MIAAIYPSETSYMGEQLDSLRVCTLTTEKNNSTTPVQTVDYDHYYDYLNMYNDYDYLSAGPGKL